MIKYSHFILTRFNLHLYKHKKDKEADDWLEKRFNIFENYCLPSICNQKNKKFRWIVIYDYKTPKKYLDKINSYKNICTNYKNIFSHTCSPVNYIKESIKEEDCILTTRLDNDDCLSDDAILNIQKNIEERDLLFINILNGYIYDKLNNQYYKSRSQSNSFITVLEKITSFKTIFGWGNHANLLFDQKQNIKNINEGRWMQIIHENNIKNKVRGKSIGLEKPIGF